MATGETTPLEPLPKELLELLPPQPELVLPLPQEELLAPQLEPGLPQTEVLLPELPGTRLGLLFHPR